MALFANLLAQKKKIKKSYSYLEDIKKVPSLISEILNLSDEIFNISKEFINVDNFLYLGRGYQFPVALEGALKLKEISYIHAEGYPAAEMKHGPIALIDKEMPVVVIVTKNGFKQCFRLRMKISHFIKVHFFRVRSFKTEFFRHYILRKSKIC